MLAQARDTAEMRPRCLSPGKMVVLDGRFMGISLEIMGTPDDRSLFPGA